LHFNQLTSLTGIEPEEEDEDAPRASVAMREAITQCRARRPAGSINIEQVTNRFGKEVLEAFRATGRGWQTRMNDALKAWLKEVF